MKRLGIIIMLLCQYGYAGEIYKYVDKNGVTTWSDKYDDKKNVKIYNGLGILIKDNTEDKNKYLSNNSRIKEIEERQKDKYLLQEYKNINDFDNKLFKSISNITMSIDMIKNKRLEYSNEITKLNKKIKNTNSAKQIERYQSDLKKFEDGLFNYDIDLKNAELLKEKTIRDISSDKERWLQLKAEENNKKQ